MFNRELTHAVDDFTTLVLPLSEKDLEREWIWNDHDEEGIRFAFFVTLQELRHLAVTLSTLRPKPTPAQHILSQYHAAYMDLQAALLGISNEDAERVPSEGEWHVQKAYAHILGTELNFTITIRYALEKHRASVWIPEKYSDEDADRLAGISDEEYLALIKSPLEKMITYHQELHQVIVEEFSRITDQELDLPSTFWEETRFPIKHRLHRYEAHFAQHTVQIDKTLVAIGRVPSESKRLLRRIYAALAEAEGMMIGAKKMDETVILATASSISERTKDLSDLLG
ncbi:MAG TPA: DinB family protein [Anaerolineales bacterium]|nr:DinB family protein [Anaerolineales bacterium]